MDSEELLAQLADIHLPGAVSYWPPAPGWWVLFVLLLGAGVMGIRYLRTQTLHKRIKAEALAELERCYEKFANDDVPTEQLNQRTIAYVNECNSVLRRVAIWHFPIANVASLGGDAWVDFIRQNGSASALTDELANALSHGRFQTECQVDADQMLQLGREWIASLYAVNPMGIKGRQAGQESGSDSDEGVYNA